MSGGAGSVYCARVQLRCGGLEEMRWAVPTRDSTRLGTAAGADVALSESRYKASKANLLRD